MKRASLTVACGDGSSYPIVFDSLDFLAHALADAGLKPGPVLIVTDLNVAEHLGDRVEALLAWAGFTTYVEAIPAGEKSKSTRQLEALYEWALSKNVERSTPVIALGGGVVGDLAGYAAATLLRGLPFVQIPTTVVAQVDSAIGGKTGINHRMGKNLIGAFHAPRLVFVDSSVLATLTVREWTSGLAEAVKHACICDADFFGWLEVQMPHVLERTNKVVAPFIQRAAAIKIDVVSQDEHEAGLRMLLNFGHTFGHAIERVAGYGTYTHGEAVALGMRAAVHLSHTLHPALPIGRLLGVIEQLPVPESNELLSVRDLIEAMQHDKKAHAGNVRFVLLRGIGDAYVQGNIPSDAVAAAICAGLGRRVTA